MDKVLFLFFGDMWCSWNAVLPGYELTLELEQTCASFGDGSCTMAPLNSVYVPWYRTCRVFMHVLYKICTSSVHQTCTLVDREYTTAPSCTPLHRNLWVLYHVWTSWQKMYNGSKLNMFVQLLCNSCVHVQVLSWHLGVQPGMDHTPH